MRSVNAIRNMKIHIPMDCDMFWYLLVQSYWKLWIIFRRRFGIRWIRTGVTIGIQQRWSRFMTIVCYWFHPCFIPFFVRLFYPFILHSLLLSLALSDRICCLSNVISKENFTVATRPWLAHADLVPVFVNLPCCLLPYLFCSLIFAQSSV